MGLVKEPPVGTLRVDLRSDTQTLPTDEMREAMARAEVGDCMKGEDPTMNRLEALAAKMVGKEEAIFVASGTMGNLVCLMSHSTPGDEFILEATAHTYYYEVGGYARIAGLSPRFVHGRYGVMDPDDIRRAVRPVSPFFPRPRLLCIENTHMFGGGNAICPEEMRAMADAARDFGLAVHLDGSRIFNAAAALCVGAPQLTCYADSVMFCLSKGLSAPVGSIVAGDREFVQRARHNRKVLGGDMRQAGILAAAGIVALEQMVGRLGEDNRRAAELRRGLQAHSELVVEVPPVPTNMVYFDVGGLRMTGDEFVAAMGQQQVLCSSVDRTRVRMVTARHIGEAEAAWTLTAVSEIVARQRGRTTH